MDIAALTQEVSTFLMPFLPYLFKASEKASEEAGKKLGADAWDKAKALWSRLRPQIEAKPAAQETIQDIAKAPKDEDAQAAFRLQLKKLLTEDENLTGDVARLWDEAKAIAVTIMAAREHSVVAQKIEGSTVITGDQNVVKS